MTSPILQAATRGDRLPYRLLVVLIVVIWAAGGASRGDVIGQPLVRLAATLALAAFLIIAPLTRLRLAKIPAIILGASICLLVLQLVPLPPAIWTALPARGILEGASAITGSHLPWRPLSMSPSWTINALGSMIVPVTTLMLASNVDRKDHIGLLGVLIVLGVLGAFLGLLQFSGGRFDHPLINDIPGKVSGNFANRNHFALYLAISCVTAWTWATGRRKISWQRLAALAMSAVFAMMILAAGSRTGLVLLVVAAIASFVIQARATDLSSLRRHRGRTLIVATAAILTIAGLVGLSIGLDRAATLSRVASGGADLDLRVRLVPETLRLAGQYFPFGSGFGTFDPVFRIAEPTNMLGPEYYNHAHSDLVEIALEGGLPGVVLLLGGIVWAVRNAWRVFRPEKRSRPEALEQLGATVIVLTILASLTDYPARTPMVMVYLVLAAVWIGPLRTSEDGIRCRSH